MMEDIRDALTAKQLEVASLVRKGYSNKEIAKTLRISIHTVKSHLTKACTKLGVANRTELAGITEWLGSESHVDLTGAWLSLFEAQSFSRGNYVPFKQYSVEFLDPSTGGYFEFTGRNLATVSSSGKLYRHETRLKVARDFVVGIWSNTNSRNSGCLHLYLSNSGHHMYGKHTGNASDNSVQIGPWTWIKIADASRAAAEELSIPDFDSVDRSFERWYEEGGPLDLRKFD